MSAHSHPGDPVQKVQSCCLSAQTQKQYEAVFRRVIRESKAGKPGKTITDPYAITRWLAKKSAAVQPDTMRRYCNAIRYVLTQKGASQQAIDDLLNYEPATPPKPPKTHARHISPRTIQMMVRAIQDTGSPYAQPLCDWLMATLATGLRTCEWWLPKTHLVRLPAIIASPDDRGRLVLIAQNAKVTTNREPQFQPKQVQITRAIDITDLPENMREAVINMLGHTKRYDYNTLGAACRKLLVKARKTLPALLPMARRVSIYTMRHQCRANLMRILDRKSVDEIMGHSHHPLQTPSRRRYGRRGSGFGGTTVLPASATCMPNALKAALESTPPGMEIAGMDV